MKRHLLLLVALLGCAGPEHHKFGAIQRTDVVTSVNGQAGDVTVGSGALYEANVAALTAVSAASLTEGQAAYVGTLKANFVLTLSSQPAIAFVRIAASGKSGYEWVRQDLSPGWWSSLAWFVNPSTGSDENDGVTSGTPLATFAEQSRRFRGRNLPGTETNSFTITLQASAPDTDYPQIHLGPNYRSASVSVTIQGTVLSVVSVGTIASAVAKLPASNLANSVTVTGFDFSTHIGQLLRIVGTSGTSSTVAAIEAAPSLGVAQLSERLVSGVVSTGFTSGQVVEIPVMTQIPGVTAEGVGVNVFLQDVVVNAAGALALTVPSGLAINRCEVRGGSSSNIQCGSLSTSSSTFVGRTFTLTGQAAFTPTGGSAINATINLSAGPIRNHLSSFGCQNATIAANDGAIVRFNGDFHSFGLASGAVGIDLRPGTAAYFAGAYYGSGNSSGAAAIRAFFNASAEFSKASATMDAGLGCYVDGGDSALSGGTSVAFSATPYPSSGGPSSHGVLMAGL